MREIILFEENSRCHVALLEDGEVCEYYAYGREKASSLANAIFKGRVERIVPGMDAAFVSLGLERNGFLPLKEAPGFADQRKSQPSLQTGQEILVQVKKDPVGEKGAYLTRDITFPGTYVVFLPLDTFVGVSQRVQNESERDTLLSLGRELVPYGTGLVMRSSACSACREDIEQEIAVLQAAWEEVQKLYPQKNAPRLLYENPDPFAELLRDYPPSEIGRIVTNIKELSVSGIEVSFIPDGNLLTTFGILSQVTTALHRKVWLKSGGYLVFDLCEAMTVIDVNTGKFTGKKLLEDTIYTLNREACHEIARQIRLRSLGGILLIDFIDMQEEHHRQEVMETLKAELNRDRVKTVVHGYTSLGLVECTRKKSKTPLHLSLTVPCLSCAGSGRVREQARQEREDFPNG
jgi:ribonuclease G